MVIPSPFVYWAQTEKCVSLRIDLKNVKNSVVKILGNKLKFSGQGTGGHGETLYEFRLDLYSSIKHQNGYEPVLRIFEDRVELMIKKDKLSWWPRLTAQPQKPAWLKINFDLWKSEDGQDSEEETRDVMIDYPGMYDKLHKEELGYKPEDWKKVYLTLYNLFQFVGFMYVTCVMGVRFMKQKSDTVTDVYEYVGATMKFLTLMQYLEVLHPLFGYTKGGALVPFFQISGRAFVLFAMVDAEPRIQPNPVVFYLFMMWSVIEIVRYPFYICQLHKKENNILTWLRYTVWIPLYPLGILSELIVILRDIPYFEETQQFTVTLPNEWNFSFHFPTFLRLYVLLLTFPGTYFVMGHMNKMRKMKLKPKFVIMKSK